MWHYGVALVTDVRVNSVRATAVERLNGLSYENLVGGYQK